MFSRGIVAAMEDEAQAAGLAIDDAGSESMEASMVDVVDMSADIETGTSEMTQTVADADQLERHVEVLTDAEGEGGASPELVEATEIAVESIYARLGIYGATGIPALEAFSTKTGRARATRIAIEEIKGRIEQIWKAVKSAFVKLVNFVKEFINKLIDASKKVLVRAKTLSAKVKAHVWTSKGKVKSSGILGIISATDVSAVKENLSVGEIAKTIKEIENIAKAMPIIVNGVKSQDAFDKVTAVKTNGASTSVKAPDGFKWSEVYKVGLTQVIALESSGNVFGSTAYEASAKFTVKTNKTETKEAFEELDSLTAEEAQKILLAVEAVMGELVASKGSSNAINASLEASIKSIESLIGESGEDADGRAKKVSPAVTAIGTGCVKILTLIGSETSRACQAYLTYVERSIGVNSKAETTEKK